MYRISNVTVLGQVVLFFVRNSIIIALFLSLVLLSIAKTKIDFNKNTHNIILFAVEPIFWGVDFPIYVGKNIANYVKNYFFVYQHNKILATDNIKLKEKLLSIAYLENENNLLRDRLNFTEKEIKGHITTRLFAKTNNQNLAIISKGKKDDIKIGQVVTAKNNLVGRVIKTSNYHSYILLIDDFYSRIPVYSSISDNKAILTGENNNFLKLKYLSKKHNIINEEIIYTSGDGKTYPRNIPIGVTSIDKETREVIVIPFINPNKMSVVTILLQK